MSQGPLSEFLPPYIAEVEELLASARAQLLAAEASARQGSGHPRAIRELFRGIHTLKGLSAMVDVDPIVQIAHWMEASLRQADRGGGRLPGRAVETLMRGLTAIDQCLRAVSEGKSAPSPPAGLLEALELLSTQTAQPTSGTRARPPLTLEEALVTKLSASELTQLEQGLASGQRVLRVDFVPSPARAEAGQTITTVRERLAKLGEIVKVIPVSAAATADHPGGLTFVVLLLTAETEAQVAVATQLEPQAVTAVAEGDRAARPVDTADEVELPDELSGARGSGQSVVRVQAGRLDDAMDALAALVVNRSRLTRAVGALTTTGADTRELSQVLLENTRMLRDLRTAIVRIRMVRVSEVLDRLPLMVRGLRRTTGKQVSLELDVGDAELDKTVGDRLFPAVVHLVRNAVDHAIEAPAERRALGKSAESVLRISCHERSNSQLELSVADDGRGIDAEAVARRAGVAPPATAAGLLELLCRPGLTTQASANTTSGRGMGMDIVRRIAVDQLGGRLTLETRAGAGSRFTLKVPLSLSIVDAFIFEAGAQRFAAAVSTIDELLDLDPGALVPGPAPEQGTGGSARPLVGMIDRRGDAVPVFQLSSLLALHGAGEGRKALVVHERGQRVAFAVDRMLSQQEIVVRPLVDALVRVRGVAGATDLGDGAATLVLDLPALGEAAR
jgi:two-component system chemotaxis sensor kinase CheA